MNFRQEKPLLVVVSLNQSFPAAGFDWYFLPLTLAIDEGTACDALAHKARVAAVDVPLASTMAAIDSRSNAVETSLDSWPRALRASAVFAFATYLPTP